MATTTGDARRIAAELRRCAEMLHQLANLARKEQGRREIAREWKRKHDGAAAPIASFDQRLSKLMPGGSTR